MRGRALLVALALVLGASIAHAAPLAVDGFDTCDLTKEAIPTGTGWSSVTASSPNRCARQLVQPSGAASYYQQTYAATQTAQGYARVTWTGTGSGQRAVLGHGTSTVDGCLVQLDAASGELVLRYGTYSELGRVALTANVETGVGVSQSDGSGGSCTSSCLVTCTLYVNGSRKVGDTYASITGADYTVPTRTWIGSRNANAGTYTLTFDSLVTEDQVATPIGAAKVLPLYPNGDGALTQWNNTCSGSKFECVDDYNDTASGTDDGDSSHLLETSSGAKTDLAMTSYTLQSGESIAAVAAFAIGRETSSNSGAYRVNLRDGTNTITGATVDPPDTTYRLQAYTLSATAPDAGAWAQADLDALQLQLDDTANNSIRVSALLAYADIRSPAPPERQNLQDWNGDGGFTGACLGDSTTLGTGFGTCELNPSAGYAYSDLPGDTDLPGQCTQNNDCFTCSTSITTPCQANADCPGGETCTNWGPCSSTGRWCTIAAAELTQAVGTRGTTWLNAGIGGNTLHGLQQRVGTLMTGVGLPTSRHCRIHGNVACTPDNTTLANVCVGGAANGAACAGGADSLCPGGICVRPCGTGPLCRSDDCGTSNANRQSHCALDANYVSGSKVCSNDHGTACNVNGDCTGGGTCTDYPAPDLVYVAIGGNDLRLYPTDADCNLGAFATTPPCPPHATVAAGQPTPAVTPTPGAKACQRVRCTANSECAGTGSGLCSNDVTKACDSDGDCSPGTCNTVLSRTGTGSICTPGSCSTTTTQACASDSNCPRGETCDTGAKFCTCPCPAVPCTTEADCVTGGFVAFGGDATATWTPLCVSGRCRGCGVPYSRKVCTGDHRTPCTRETHCATAGGTCSEENPRHWEARRTVGAAEWLRRAQNLKTTIEAAGGRVIWLTYFPANQDPTMADLSNWYEARDELLATRNLILGGALGENVVDLYGLLNRADERTTRWRCVKAPSTRCATNADCPSSSECADFNRSTLRAKDDPVHQNVLGASHTGRLVATYTKQLSPVCSGDPTTGCGRCSITTATACLSSEDCPAFATGEKCLKTDSVCSGAGKGTCTRQRACWSTSNCTDHHLCTWDLGTKCQSDGDCTGKGVCRPEGTPAVGAG